MFAKLKSAWKAAPIAVAILAISLAAAGFFGFQLVNHMMRMAPPRDVAIEAWMTPRFVAHSWRVPRPVITEALEFESEFGRPPNLQMIAAERGVPVEQLIIEVETAIAEYRAREGIPSE